MREILEQWPDQRLLQLVHTRELVAQNYKTMLRVWPAAPASVYSAGLNNRDMGGRSSSAVFRASIKGLRITEVDLVVVDEGAPNSCQRGRNVPSPHEDLAVCNGGPVPLVGFTATPFRTKAAASSRATGACSRKWPTRSNCCA